MVSHCIPMFFPPEFLPFTSQCVSRGIPSFSPSPKFVFFASQFVNCCIHFVVPFSKIPCLHELFGQPQYSLVVPFSKITRICKPVGEMWYFFVVLLLIFEGFVSLHLFGLFLLKVFIYKRSSFLQWSFS